MRLAVLALLLLSLVAASAAAQPGLLVGAAEDDAKQADPAAAKLKMDLAQLAGFDAIRLTTLWQPGMKEPDDGELWALQNAAAAGALNGIRVFVSIYPRGGKAVPRTPRARAQFAAFAAAVARGLPTVRDYIVGNEPNLNRFWMPQFGPSGENLAAPGYLKLLARTYDALKGVDGTIRVVGGAVSPRGGDRAGTGRDTHSPTTFIADLGIAYRASGRRRPIMDAFAFHPYPESSRLPPTFSHPRSTTIGLADYGKLVSLLGEAFDGTAQRGSTLPILYDEFGVQSSVGSALTGAYTNRAAAAATDAVSEEVQARYYRAALELATCQRTVIGLLFFHVSDEEDLAAWQSGLYYANDLPKSSLPAVRDAALAARSATLAACPVPWRGPR